MTHEQIRATIAEAERPIAVVRNAREALAAAYGKTIDD